MYVCTKVHAQTHTHTHTHTYTYIHTHTAAWIRYGGKPQNVYMCVCMYVCMRLQRYMHRHTHTHTHTHIHAYTYTHAQRLGYDMAENLKMMGNYSDAAKVFVDYCK